MDSLLSRYRHLTLLLVVLFAQLLLLAYQVRTDQDVRLIRVWAVTAVTPAARFLEFIRSSTTNLISDYVLLRGAREESQRLRAELDRVKMENLRLHTELATADRVRALEMFRATSPSKTLAARIIGSDPGASARAVIIDRGTVDGVKRGMAVLTPDGIVGKVAAAYPTASQVQLITDSTFAAGVISQKGQARGIVKGRNERECDVLYVRDEQPLEMGEVFYTSGTDRIFPRGHPVGRVVKLEPGNPFRLIRVAPTASIGELEEVLVVVEGVHQDIPGPAIASPEFSMLPPPAQERAAPEQPAAAEATPAPSSAPASATPASLITDADRVREKYKRINEGRSQRFGQGYTGAPTGSDAAAENVEGSPERPSPPPAGDAAKPRPPDTPGAGAPAPAKPPQEGAP